MHPYRLIAMACLAEGISGIHEIMPVIFFKLMLLKHHHMLFYLLDPTYIWRRNDQDEHHLTYILFHIYIYIYYIFINIFYNMEMFLNCILFMDVFCMIKNPFYPA